jgi:hypothetical protein
MLSEIPGEKNGELGERGGEYVTNAARKTWQKLGPLKMLYLMKHTN